MRERGGKEGGGRLLTSTSSLPASFRYALVHFTFLGFRFILKFLWHLLLQNLKTCRRSRP